MIGLSVTCEPARSPWPASAGVQRVEHDAAVVADDQARVRTVTDKPIIYVVLSHYHAVRVLGASAYKAEAVIASQETIA